STSTRSPSCLCHSSTVPSATESPIAGITTWTVPLSTAIWFNSNAWWGRRTASPATDENEPEGARQRYEAPQHRHRRRQPEWDDVGPRGRDAEQRHGDPDEAMGEA